MPLGQDKERATDGAPPGIGWRPHCTLLCRGKDGRPSPGRPAPRFKTGSCKRVSVEPTAPGFNLFSEKAVTGGKETWKEGVFVRKWLMPLLFYPFSCH